MKRLLILSARPLEFCLGAVFLLAAVLKALDVNLFVAQIYAYRVIQEPFLLGPLALTTLGTEAFLGVAMLLGVRPRMAVLGLAQAMLVFFTGLIVYAWLAHGLEDCGCFGAVKFPPEAAIAKNIVLMLFAAGAWAGLRMKEGPPAVARLSRASLGAALAVASIILVYSGPQLYGAQASTLPAINTGKSVDPKGETEKPGEGGEATATAPVLQAEAGLFSGYAVQDNLGNTLDLGSGSYLVVMLSMTCEHCKESVPLLNDLVFMSDLPPLVALCYEPEPGSLEGFSALTSPMFPMHGLGNSFLEFSKLIGDAPPRLSLVREGRPVFSWDDTIPSPEEILQIVDTISSDELG